MGSPSRGIYLILLIYTPSYFWIQITHVFWLYRRLAGDLPFADFPWLLALFELLDVGVFDFERLPDDEDEVSKRKKNIITNIFLDKDS